MGYGVWGGQGCSPDSTPHTPYPYLSSFGSYWFSPAFSGQRNGVVPRSPYRGGSAGAAPGAAGPPISADSFSRWPAAASSPGGPITSTSASPGGRFSTRYDPSGPTVA